jgi:hypothetical protein
VAPAEAFLADQFPALARTKIAPTLKNAYAAARLLIDNEPILQVASAADNAGRIIQWAVDLGFDRLCQSGELPFEPRWRPFHKPTGRYLEMRASHSVITISQCANPKKQPRDVVFRANKRANNQRSLFRDNEGGDDQSNVGLVHVLLLHGYQELNFAYLGIPHERKKLGYHFKTKNLMMMPYEVQTPEPPMEVTDLELVMTMKEEIDKARRDHGGEG